MLGSGATDQQQQACASTWANAAPLELEPNPMSDFYKHGAPLAIAKDPGQPHHSSTIRRVFKALLFDLRRIFPDNGAGARIDELKGVEDIVTGARRGAGG
jgi:hypothetical protein